MTHPTASQPLGPTALVEPTAQGEEWPRMPLRGEEPKWPAVPLENTDPRVWNEVLNAGTHDHSDIVTASKKSVELVVRGGLPLLVKKEEDGSFTLPIRRAGSLFSFLTKLELKKRGLQRLRISPDGTETSIIGEPNQEELTVVGPSLQRKIPRGNAAMVPDFEYRQAVPKVKSFKGKLHFVIFH